MIASLLSLALIQQHLVAYEFVYTNHNAKTISVAGTFNSWNKDADPLKKAADGYTWRLKKDLPVGKHQYKFVIDGETWVPDPKGDSRDDGYGNINTFLSIMPEDFKKPAKVGDGEITESVAKFDPSQGDITYNSASKTARFLARARKSDVSYGTVSVSGKNFKMIRVGGDDVTDIFSATIPIPNPNNTTYSVHLVDALPSGSSRMFSLKSERGADLTQYAEASVPAWTQSAVFYQIFPDRFTNGSKTNDPKDVESWGAKPTYSNFMGGDLAGVKQHINYLSDLGITGIYFNPVFASPSNHGYETDDYKLIEPRLGTNEEFGQLTRDLKNRGIQVVLDGVFNHTSVNFAPFKEIREKGKSATTLDWYTIKSFPVVPKENPPYEAWAGYASLPKLNVLNPATKDYVFSVLDFWNKNAEIAGWRLDVANEVPEPFWQEFRTKLKGIDQDSWIIGENWSNSSQWLKGDQWDSAMNYPMRGAILNHIALGTTTSQQFLDEMMAAYLMYGPAVSANMLNSISTHDVPRFKFFAKEDDKLNGMGAVALFAVPGVPCIYYGDELGMTGGVDPDNRRGMEWDRADGNNSTLNLYKKLIAARRGCRALQVGEPIPLLADDTKRISSFARVAGEDIAIVCFNRSEKDQSVELDVSALPQAQIKTLVDVVSGKDLVFSGGARLRLNLPAKSAVLAVARDCSEPEKVQSNLTHMVIQ